MSASAKTASLLALLALLVACSRETPTSGPAADPTRPSQPAGASDVTAAVQSLPEFQSRIESYAGRVVVVDLWALW